jgi:uncharacterized membrane protein
MAELVAVIYPDPETAQKVRARLLELQSEYLIELEDAVVVTKDDKGNVQLHQAIDLVKQGAIGGGLWGSLIGLLFMNPLLGLAVGAAVGALSGKMSDYGIPDPQMREMAQSFVPGSAALFVLIRKVTADKVLPEIAGFGGTIIRSSLSQDEEAKLRQALAAHGVTPAPASAPATP